MVRATSGSSAPVSPRQLKNTSARFFRFVCIYYIGFFLWRGGHRPASQTRYLHKNCCFLAQGPSVRMRSTSRFLPPSFRDLFASSVHKLRRWRARSVHLRRICLTVGFLACIRTLHLKSLAPYVGREIPEGRFSLFAFLPFYHQRTKFLAQANMQLESSFSGHRLQPLPRRSLVHSSLHYLIACLVIWDYFADSSSFTHWAFAVVDVASSSLMASRLSFFNLQPVASFADLFAAGTQWFSTVDPHCLRQSEPVRWVL